MTAGPPFLLAWEALPSQWAGATRRLLRSLMLRLFAMLCAVFVVFAGFAWATSNLHPGPLFYASGPVVAALMAAGAREWVILRARIRWWRHPEQYGTGPTTLHADADGLSMTSSTSALSSRWETIQGVLRTRRLLILRVGRGVGLAIPRSAFADDASETAFVDHVRAWCAAADQDDEGAAPAAPEGAGPKDDPEAVHLAWDHAIEDSIAFVRWARWDRSRNRLLVTIGGALLLLTSTAAATLLLDAGDGPVEVFPFAVLGILAVLLGTLPLWGRRLSEWRLRRQVAADPRGHPLGRHTLHAGPTGLYTEMPRATASLAWSQVTEVVACKEHTFLMLGPWHAWVVPDRAFDSPEAAERFRARAESWRTRAAGPVAHRPRPSGENPFEAPGET